MLDLASEGRWFVVETGENPTRRSRPDIRIYERPPFAVIITDFEPLSNVRAKGRKRACDHRYCDRQPTAHTREAPWHSMHGTGNIAL
jgi:hypothetical protein